MSEKGVAEGRVDVSCVIPRAKTSFMMSFGIVGRDGTPISPENVSVSADSSIFLSIRRIEYILTAKSSRVW